MINRYLYKAKELINLFINKFSVEVSIILVLLVYTKHGHTLGRYNHKNILNEQLIRSDGIEYYQIIPAVFIYNSPTYTFLENKEAIKKGHISRFWVKKSKNGYVSRMTIGGFKKLAESR